MIQLNTGMIRIYQFYSSIMLLCLAAIMKTQFAAFHNSIARGIKLVMLLVLVSFLVIGVHKCGIRAYLSIKNIAILLYLTVSLFMCNFFAGVSIKNIGIPLEFPLFYFGIFSLFISSYLSIKDYKRLFFVMLTLFSLHVAISYWIADYSMFVKKIDFKTFYQNTWHGPYRFTVDFALAAGCTASLWIGMVLKNFVERRYTLFSFSLLMCTLSFFAVVMSGARSVLIGLFCFGVVTIFYLFKLYYTEIIKDRVQLIILLLLFLGAVLIILQSGLLTLVLQKTVRQGTSGRFDVWQAFFIKQYHSGLKVNITGVGYDVNSVVPLSKFTYQNLHNFVFTIWARSGIVSALLIFMITFYAMIKNLFLNKMWFIAAAGIVPLINGLLDDKVIIANSSISALFFVITIAFISFDANPLNDKKLRVSEAVL